MNEPTVDFEAQLRPTCGLLRSLRSSPIGCVRQELVFGPYGGIQPTAAFVVQRHCPRRARAKHISARSTNCDVMQHDVTALFPNTTQKRRISCEYNYVYLRLPLLQLVRANVGREMPLLRRTVAKRNLRRSRRCERIRSARRFDRQVIQVAELSV